MIGSPRLLHFFPCENRVFSGDSFRLQLADGAIRALRPTVVSNFFKVAREQAADSRSRMSDAACSNSLNLPMTTCFASLIRSANSSGRMSRKPASKSKLHTRSSSVSLSGRFTLCTPVLIVTQLGHKLKAHGLLRIGRFVPRLLEPEIGEGEVLVQFGPERLLLIPGIHSSLSH